MNEILVLLIAGGYLYALFAVAFYVDARARPTRKALVPEAWIYALSIAVYCTSWTFYGSVGRSAATGIGFLPIYIGPILIFVGGQFLLRKILRIAKSQRITSIADFISARYGKSQRLAGLVTVIAVIGVMPYISLQLKAVSSTFDILHHYPDVITRTHQVLPFYADTAFYIAILMSVFVIAFGTRHVDATEQHRGMVTAVALESLVKLVAFVAVGLFVTYGMFDGFGDVFSRARREAALAPLLDIGAAVESGGFWGLTALSMMAIICLPRQFQVTVVENVDESHLKSAAWLFPLYLVVINIFVLPIALAGLLTFSGKAVDPDTFVLTLPIAAGNAPLALFAFIGGLSAATGMIIVETIALATMICNDLVMPMLIRGALVRADAGADLAGLVKGVRRAAIVLVLLLGYLYVRLIGESYALVSIGLVSFVAAAQFAPAIVGGIFWKGATRTGALAGLIGGFAVWIYTLLLPSFARSGWLPIEFVTGGPFSVSFLNPAGLFGFSGMDSISHGLLWTMVVNVGCYVLFSIRSSQDVVERGQAQAFVDVFDRRAPVLARVWQAEVRIGDLGAVLERFMDAERVRRALQEYATAHNLALDPAQQADLEFIDFTEHLLAGAIGAALARVVIASAIHEKDLSVEGMMDLLSDASQTIRINWEILREAIDNISQGISVFDKDARLVVWNRRFLELLEFPGQMAAVGRPFVDFVRHNAQRGEYGEGDVEQQVAARTDPGRILALRRYEHERPNGSVIEIYGKPLPNGGFVTTYTDITERKQAERELEQRVDARTRELRASEERFRDLAETASDWFWEMDSELRFTYLSDRFYELSAISPAGMIGKHRWDMVSPEENVRDPEKWRRHREDCEAHRPLRDFEYEIRASDERTTHVRVSGRPRFNEQGNFIGYRGTGTNITELLRTQAELLRSEKLAALGGLVAGVAHEINTPVGIGLTAATYFDEQTREFEQIYASGKVRRSDIDAFIHAAHEVSSSLVTNLRRAADMVRSFKQVAVDQSSDQKRRFTFKEYLEETLRSLHPRLKRTSHAVDVVCPDALELNSFPGAFSQIFTNLVMNSLIHGFENKPRGHIAIEVMESGGWLRIRYSDDGKGIPEENAKRVFQPFFTTKRGRGGSGLGLHVVYNLVTQTLGGRIECVTAPERGVTFLIRIPISEEASHETLAAE